MPLYAGIGSRRTPEDILAIMRNIGRERAFEGWTLRSGRAAGADTAFETGHRQCSSTRLELFTPYTSVAMDERLHAIAASLHPNWPACSDFARRAHTRNVAIILGADLQHPVSEVLYWTPGGQLVGGTAMALRIAAKYSIPTQYITIPWALAHEYAQ